jgi:dTMP kinase
VKSRSNNSIRVLLRIPAFRRLWAAITVSSFGDWMGLLATTSLAAYLTRDTSSLAQGAAVSGVLLTRLAPDLLLGPVAGSLVDRLDRRTVAIVGDTIAGLLYLSIVFAGNLTWLLLAQFLVEAVGLFSNPAKQAMWVNIVPRERLAVANQLNYVSIYGMVPVAAVVFALLSTVAQFFGAPVAAGADESTSLFSGGPTSAVVINIALVIDAITYFIAAVTVLASRGIIPSYLGERTAARGIMSLIAEGISFISHNRVMRAIYIGILGAFGAGGLVAGVAQLYVSALGAGTAGYGILFGSVFTGLALGMLIGPKVLPTVPRRTIFTSSIGAAGVMLVVMSLMGDFVGAAICAAVVGLFAGIAWINGFTMIGQEVADKLRGRVFAFVMSSVRITLLATIALGPVLAGFIGAHEVSVGQFQWLFSGPAVVLAIGGVVAFVVSVFAGRQVGGGAASRALKRALRRRGGGLLGNPAEHRGVLIAVEGHDSELVGALQDAIVEHVRSAGYRAIAQRPDVGWIAPPSFSALSSAAGGVITDSSLSNGVTAVAERPRHEADLETGAEQSPAAALRALAVLSERASGGIRPDLELGSVVVCRDYVDATVVRYGVCGGLDEEQVLQTAVWAVEGVLPDLTVLVDTPIDDSDWPALSSPLSNGSGSGSGEQGPGPSATSGSSDGAADTGRSNEPANEAGPPFDVLAPESALMDERAAYRVRAATAPERYVVVRTTPEPDAALDVELAGRVDSVLRLRAPELAEPVMVGDRDGRDAA